MWLDSVACRARWSTRASTGSPASQRPLPRDHLRAPGPRRAAARPRTRARQSPSLALDRADVGDLPAAGSVERRLGELDQIAQPAAALAVAVSAAGRAVAADAAHGADRRALLLGLIAGEARLAPAPRRARPSRRAARRRARCRLSRPHGARPRARCSSISSSKSPSIDSPSSASSSLVISCGKPYVSCSRKTVVRRHRRAPRLACSLDLAAQHLHALGERAPEALLLGGQPHVDRLRVLDELRVGAAHDLAHPRGVAREEAGRELQRAALLDRPAHHAAQHVAAILVGGHDAVGDQEGHRARVVGEDPQRAVVAKSSP